MKRTVILIMAAWFCCSAEAALMITVDGVVDPPDSEVVLAPGEQAVIGVWSDGQYMGGAYYLGVSKGHPGAVDAGVDCPWPPMPTPSPDGPCNVYDPAVGFNIPFVHFMPDPFGPQPPEGVIVDNIMFRCEGAGDVTVILTNAELTEILDTQVIHQVPEVEYMEYGDCPAPYPTLLADNGARHVPDSNLFLGQVRDRETDGQPSLAADGDDANLVDDEDGVFFVSQIMPGQPADVEVVATVAGLLDAWIDLNVDGDWDDAGEQIFTSFPLQGGSNVLAFNVPSYAQSVGRTYARFRVSSAGGLGPAGPAADGEVEDYAVALECFPDWYTTYEDWVRMGKPNCWCGIYGNPPCPYQCDGDCNCDGQVLDWRVYTDDLTCIANNWKKTISDPTLNPFKKFKYIPKRPSAKLDGQRP